MGSIIEPIHVAIDVAWTFFVLIRDIVNVAAWCFIGLCCCWGHAFKSQGLLKTREPVEDNIRVARHTFFVVWTLCIGSILVITLEATVAAYVEPWHLQLLANIALSLGAFVVGNSIFGSSHDWVLRDPKLEPPLFLLDVCAIS